jgi:hypothetical protein
MPAGAWVASQMKKDDAKVKKHFPEGVDNETTVTAEINCQVSITHMTTASS